MQFVCVYSSTELSNGNVLKLNGMVEWERDNGNCKGGFSVDSYSYIDQYTMEMSCPKIINASQKTK